MGSINHSYNQSRFIRKWSKTWKIWIKINRNTFPKHTGIKTVVGVVDANV